MSLATQSIARQRRNELRREMLRREAEGRQQEPEPIDMRPFAGRMPTQGQIPWSPHGLDTRLERQRRAYYDQLIQQGYTPEQISGAMAYEQGIKPPSKTPQTVGSLIGSVLFSKLIPGPADDVALGYRFLRGAGQAASAGAGGAAGKATQMFADPDMEFNLSELKRVAGEETVYEGITLGLAPLAKRMFRPVTKTVIPGAQEMSDQLARKGKQLGMKQPTRFLPAQFSENELIDTMQGIGEGGLVDPGVITRYKKGQIVAATSILDDVTENLSKNVKNMSPNEMANLILDTVEDHGVSHRIMAEKLYGAVDVAVGDSTVKLSNPAIKSQELLRRYTKAKKFGLSPESEKILKRLADSTDEVVSFETAQDMRSGLLDIVRKGSSKLSPDPKAVSIAQTLVGSIDDAMEQAAKDAGPEAYAKWRRANWFYRAGKQRYHNKLINKLVHDLPDNPDAAKAIFKNEENILRVKKAVGPQKFQDVKKAWIESIVRDSQIRQAADITRVSTIGDPLGDRILRQYNGIGQAALDASFTKAEQESIRNAARILATIQAKTGGHSGALRFVQGTALVGVMAAPLYSEYPGGKEAFYGSGMILLGPTMLSRLMTKPWFGKWLSEGYRFPPGTQKYVATTARLVRNVMQERKKINEERERRSKEPFKPYVKMGP